MHAVAYRAHTFARVDNSTVWNADARYAADDFRANEQTTLNLLNTFAD